MTTQDLPNGWAVARLGELVELKYGKALPEKTRSGSGFPVYGSNGIVGAHSESLTNGPTIVIGRKGSVGAVTFSLVPCSPIDTTYYVDHVPANQFQFWVYKLSSLDLPSLNKSTAIPGINREDAYRLTVQLPPTDEQQRIADRLDTVLARVDAVNDRLARVAPLLKRFRKAVLAAATSGRLTADWRISSVDQPLTLVAQIEDAGSWPFDAIPATWHMQSALECFKDCTDSTRKVPQAEYAIEGVIPVVDQGAQLVGGYVNDCKMQSTATLPVIVFGDHTRCIKWVDFPFAQGADGVKVLAPQLECDRYGWVLLKALHLPDKGYSRHFKYLKRSMFPVPPAAEQSEIVRRVDILFAFADRLEARLQEAQTTASRLTPALLAKAFRGELVPQDPADEPAAELLRRLTASRAEASSTKRSRGVVRSAAR